jgi:hypothetical protein
MSGDTRQQTHKQEETTAHRAVYGRRLLPRQQAVNVLHVAGARYSTDELFEWYRGQKETTVNDDRNARPDTI